jgi:hypothetical protein
MRLFGAIKLPRSHYESPHAALTAIRRFHEEAEDLRLSVQESLERIALSKRLLDETTPWLGFPANPTEPAPRLQGWRAFAPPRRRDGRTASEDA